MMLYDGGRVPNARRVRMFLAEKGITVPMTPVDLGRNEHKSTAFSALNPLHRVPVLVLDDGTVLTESIAICRYFEELHPEPPLFGTGARERALVEMWQRRLELELFFPIAHVFRHLHPAMATFEVPQVPVGCGVFPAEIIQPSRRWIEAHYGDRLVHVGFPERGGHFAALEVPELLVEEIRSTFRTLR